MSEKEIKAVCNNSMCQVELHDKVEIKEGLCWDCLKERERDSNV